MKNSLRVPDEPIKIKYFFERIYTNFYSYIRHLFFLTLAACILALGTCSSSNDSPAQAIVDKAIEAHRGKQFENLHLAFDFRDKHYPLERNGVLFSYTREFADSTGQVKDMLTNNCFCRHINGNTV